MKGSQGKLVAKPKSSNSNSASGMKGSPGNNKVKTVIKDSVGKMSWDIDNYGAAKRGGMYHAYSRDAAEKITSAIVNEAGGKTRS